MLARMMPKLIRVSCLKTPASLSSATPQEWEAAARAGQDTNFWWGNEFKSGKANTGWAGTPWSKRPALHQLSRSYQRQRASTIWLATYGNGQPLRRTQQRRAWSFSPEEAKVFNELYVAPSTAASTQDSE